MIIFLLSKTPREIYRLNRVQIIQTSTSYQCQRSIKPIIDVPGITFYKDSDGFKTGHASIIDPDRQAIRNALVKPLSDFNIQINEISEQIWRENGTDKNTREFRYGLHFQ